jgi:hypothetical protein
MDEAQIATFGSAQGITVLVLCPLIALAVLWPDAVLRTLTYLILRWDLEVVNWRGYWMGRKMHRQLCRLAKEAGRPQPGPFVFVRFEKRGRRP